MKVAIQFNSYDGMGGELKTTYRMGYVEFDSKENGNVVCYSIYNRPEINFKLKANNIEMFDTGMKIKGTNPDNYGIVDMIIGSENSPIWDLALYENEVGRLETIAEETLGYFQKNYGDPKDIKKIANKTVTEEKIKILEKRLSYLKKCIGK